MAVCMNIVVIVTLTLGFGIVSLRVFVTVGFIFVNGGSIGSIVAIAIAITIATRCIFFFFAIVSYREFLNQMLFSIFILGQQFIQKSHLFWLVCFQQMFHDMTIKFSRRFLNAFIHRHAR